MISECYFKTISLITHVLWRKNAFPMSELFLDPLQILLWNKFCFPSELVCYFVYYNLSSLCSSLCRRSFSSSRSNMISHCVRYCSIGFSGNEVCKALMPPRSAPPYGTKEIKKKKIRKIPLLLSSKFKQQRRCYLKFSLTYFKA